MGLCVFFGVRARSEFTFLPLEVFHIEQKLEFRYETQNEMLFARHAVLALLFVSNALATSPNYLCAFPGVKHVGNEADSAFKHMKP